MANRNFFAWDFDGVVCDSTYECLVTSRNAWEQIHNTGIFRTSMEEFTDDEVKRFQKNRGRVIDAGEYYVIYKSQELGLAIDDQKVYDNLVTKWKNELMPYKEIFLQCRNKLKEDNIMRWLSLHPSFEDITLLLKELNENDSLYIVTMKDKPSVYKLLKYFGIRISPNRVLSSEDFTSKLEALKYISEKHKLSAKHIYFIDDNIKHILGPMQSGYNVYMAAWCNPIMDCILRANDLGISILETTKEAVRKIKVATMDQ